MTMLNSKQRAYLKSIAAGLDPVFQIGKGGVSKEQAEGVAQYLKAHEIVKIKVLDNSLYTAREAAEEIAQMTSSEVVICIGSKAVLFKRNPEKPVISQKI